MFIVVVVLCVLLRCMYVRSVSLSMMSVDHNIGWDLQEGPRYSVGSCGVLFCTILTTYLQRGMVPWGSSRSRCIEGWF